MTTASSLTPTGWYLYVIDGVTHAVARQYWPASTLVEVWNPTTPVWTDRPILEALSDSHAWVDSTQAVVEAWVASKSGKPDKPDKTAVKTGAGGKATGG